MPAQNQATKTQTRGKATKPKHPSKLKDAPLPPIDDSLTLDGAVSAISTLVDQQSGGAWQIGAYYNYIVEKNFALPKPHVHAVDYVCAKIGYRLAPRMIKEYGIVSKSFGQPATLQYGASKLYELFAYCTAHHIKDIPADPGSMPVSIVGPDGKVTTKPFSDCTEGDLLAALKTNHPVPVPKGLAAAIKDWNGQFAGQCRFETEAHPDHISLAIRGMNCDNKGEVENVINELPPAISGTKEWAFGARPVRGRSG